MGSRCPILPPTQAILACKNFNYFLSILSEKYIKPISEEHLLLSEIYFSDRIQIKRKRLKCPKIRKGSFLTGKCLLREKKPKIQAADARQGSTTSTQGSARASGAPSHGTAGSSRSNPIVIHD